DLPRGGGTHSDRSMRMMGTVLYEISKLIIKKAMPVAAHLLQVDEDELVFDDGKFILGDNQQTVDILTVAAAFKEFTGKSGRLAAVWEQKGRIPAFPYGASGVEIEIDPETGALTICRYVLVDDCGLAINPMIVEGQVHGGIVQGAGQAIGECAVFDTSSGQLLNGSFMDYAIPRADQFPNFSVGSLNVKTKGNPLGVKAGGEAGTVPALALIGNAVMDALSPFKIRHFDMPFSASKIWGAIQDAKKDLAV
ncbi:MAG TPA: xanthine dehydrogenase family protein molybdopterin-binding subunit, partial [Rhodospirillales bacterium]|nr:xanthine dehydrogenase family protein molybdopterin-binding subunit [Rhodospirillales bacterium]